MTVHNATGLEEASECFLGRPPNFLKSSLDSAMSEQGLRTAPWGFPLASLLSGGSEHIQVPGTGGREQI